MREVLGLLLQIPLVFCVAYPLGYSTMGRMDQQSAFYRQLQNILQTHPVKQRSEDMDESWPLTSVDAVGEDETWPTASTLARLGQVSGLDVDNQGFVHVFHRGDRVWDGSTFNANGIFQQKKLGPIPNDTVLIIDPKSGEIVRSWGKNRFYMPHGLTVDVNNNTWITDVALHQIFKFLPGQEEPALVLGEAFVPGDDKKHFCKPTDVAAASNGEFFVSDGYCNSRILMYDKDGHFMQQIGVRGPTDMMLVPHSLTLFEEQDLLCVADRENYRVLCYSAGRGEVPAGFQQLSLNKPPMGRVFGIDHLGNYLFAVNGPDGWNQESGLPKPHGFIIDLRNDNLINHWGPKHGFVMPHDIAVAPDGTAVYVGEIGAQAPRKIYKFVPQI